MAQNNNKNNKVDFHKLGSELWDIANIFRDDTLKTTEYLEEFSYFLFLKLFDEGEKQKEELAHSDGTVFKSDLPENLRFSTWAKKILESDGKNVKIKKDGKIEEKTIVDYVRGIFLELSEVRDHDGRDLSLFRRLFKDHIWRIKYSPTIKQLIERLKDLELEQNFDVMGRAYEFVVQKLGEQKQYGQYFTPRHIIHFMVELANPQIREKIYDPAAGTGGFILRAFEVIKDSIDQLTKAGMNVKESTATYNGIQYDEAEKLYRNLKAESLYAVEKAPDVYKLALMNMILHNDGKSNLREADSLDNRAQVEHKEKYDVVLSNPPYGPLAQSRVGTFEFHTKRYEALFIQHIMAALKHSETPKKRSRAVVIILDKILFDNSFVFKNIRMKLLREFDLKAVFSMPAGIFQPYSGVKTTVLYFEKPTKEEWNETKKQNAYTTKKVLFVDVKDDGFTLTTQRRPINGAFQGDDPNIYEPPCGNLPKAVEVFRKWMVWLNTQTDNLPDFVDNDFCWTATIEEIKAKDYNLNPGLYRKTIKGKQKWEVVELRDIVKVSFGERITKKEHEGCLYPVYGGGGITFYTDNYNREDSIVVSRFGMSEECVRIVNGRFWLLDSGFSVEPKDANQLSVSYLYYVLKCIEDKVYDCGRGVGQKNIDMESFYNIQIPLPPLPIQQEMVARLDKQQAIIEQCNAMEKAILEAGIDDSIFEGDWEWAELGKVIIFSQYGLSDKAIGTNNDIPILGMNNISYYGELILDNLKYISLDKKNIDKYRLYKGDILFNRTNSKELVGKTAVFNADGDFVFASYIIRFRVDENKLIPQFVGYYFNSKKSKDYLSSLCRAIIGQANINLQELKQIKIPIPPLQKQQEIVDFLSTQFETLNRIRKLKENAHKTIKMILDKEVFS